jgi:hypothetical protein
MENAVMAASDEDPETEVRRFASLLSLLDRVVPELADWRAASSPEGPMTIIDAGLETRWNLFDDDARLIVVDDIWRRLLQVVELVLAIDEGWWTDEATEDDAATLDAFAGAGIVCDVTRAIDSIQAVLPFMGPRTIEVATQEVCNHAESRGFDVDAIDWTTAGASFVGLDLDFMDYLPTPR